MTIAQIVNGARAVSKNRIPPKPSGKIHIPRARVLESGDILVQVRHTGVTVNGIHTVSLLFRNPQPVNPETAKANPINHFKVNDSWAERIMTLGFGGKGQHFERMRKQSTDIAFNCTCPDFYFTWGIWVFRQGSLVGQEPPPYKRLTPPPPIGRPYRNPKKIPGGCKHIINSIHHMAQMGYFK